MLKERRNAIVGLPSDLTEALGVRELKATALKVEQDKNTTFAPKLQDVKPESLSQPMARWDRVRGYLDRAPMTVDSMPPQRKPQPKWSSNSKYFVAAHKRLSKEDLTEVLHCEPTLSLVQVECEEPPNQVTKRRRRKVLREAENSNYGHYSDVLVTRIRRIDRLSATCKSMTSPEFYASRPSASILGSTGGQKQDKCTTAGQRSSMLPIHKREGSDRGSRSESRYTRLVDLTATAPVGECNSSSSSEDEGWMREEDVLKLPSDRELETLPMNIALQCLLDAQRTLILGLGRMEEHWQVRLQRKQAEKKALHPRTYRRGPLLEASSHHREDSIYRQDRHQYLVRKLTELSRKHKALAVRHEQQFGGLSDQIEIEKRNMLMQLLVMEREEARIRNVLRRLDERNTDSGVGRLSVKSKG